MFARDLVIEAGAIPKLTNLLIRCVPDNEITRNVAWAISNLCRNKPKPSLDILCLAIMPLAQTLIKNEKELILSDCCWSLSYIIDEAAFINFKFMIPELLKRLIGLINCGNESI